MLAGKHPALNECFVISDILEKPQAFFFRAAIDLIS